MLACPAHDHRADVWFINSLVGSVKLCAQSGIDLIPIFWPGGLNS